MSLEDELRDLEADIVGFEGEIKQLQGDHDDLFREVSVFENEHKHKNLLKPKLPAKQTPYSTFDDAPSLITHQYFQANIKKYFEPSASADTATRPWSNSEAVLTSLSLKSKATDMALHESLMRFGGITAFPINNALYNSEDDALLGLRFDVMCHSTNKFIDPHYVILRKRQYKGSSDSDPHWLVFRYTTPLYIPMDSLAKHLGSGDQGLQTFVETVRSLLVMVQFKHSVLDNVEKHGLSSPKITLTIDRDLECRRVVLHFSPTPSFIELICGLDSIESVYASLGHKDTEITVGHMLRSSKILQLDASLTKVLEFLLDNRLGPSPST